MIYDANKNEIDFNPRSREGSDKRMGGIDRRRNHFNPRSREGSDSECRSLYYTPGISIHAPARGATLRQKLLPIIRGNFNPRSREGSDRETTGNRLQIKNFNPRSREGSDLHGLTYQATDNNFNPRSREGSDFMLRKLI